ncbi:MAG TPA: DUF2510 domain-containing protein [Galbitalea sp.]|jgi:uncharacterized membrane protein|nr:DUF2510 domain-containing protein [Galbitalea sp.]
MSDTGGPAIPAGWYSDPTNSAQLRWWDGTAWTSHLAAAPTPAPQPAPVQPQAPQVNGQQADVSQTLDTTGRPYVPFQNSWNERTGEYGPVQDFARPSQSNTAGVWLLATSYFWTGIVGFIVGLIAGAASGGSSIEVNGRLTPGGVVLEVSVWVITWILLIIAGARDNARLRQLGYRHFTSPAWLLLAPPLVYLIIRTVRVRRESDRGAAPLVFYLVSGAVLVVIAVIAVVVVASVTGLGGANLATSDSANGSSLAAGITDGLEKNGGSYTVTCTPFAKPTTTPVDVSCTAIDASTTVAHQLMIEVDPSATAGGQPTVRLLSVNPPIAQ